MNKICILGDQHFGIRNGSTIFSNYFNDFYTNVFFPYLKKHNITTVIGLGDCFDVRKAVNINALTEAKKYFFDKFDEYDINFITLVGNHDSFYNDIITVNSPSELLKQYSNIHIIDRPTNYSINDHEVLLLPWICKGNYDETLNAISSTKTDICFGHLELSGYAMYKGVISEHGMDSSLFDKFEFVFSGHYHTKSTKNNIYYTGIAYELTWSDYNDQKGFHIFDLDSRKLSFIKNPIKLFHKIFYDDTNEEDIKQDFSHLKNSYVKLIVKKKNNPYLFDLFLEELSKIDIIDLNIIEEANDVLIEELKEIDESKDTLTLLNEYVDGISAKDIDFNKLKGILGSLYHEALNVK